ncbi:MAG TPA: hypothetical protein VMG08_06095 [Allosphingosinicella sp.]|nr:hypothetical protein [Allosphingosinicella sp.]
MTEKRLTFLEALFAPKVVKLGALAWLLFASYDTLCSQFNLPTIGTLVGKVNGSLLPWWGWLLVLQAILFYALFEYVRRNTAAGPMASLESTRVLTPISTPKVALTAKEKDQAREILVSLADTIRDRWWTLFESARWMHGSQDDYEKNLPTLPALQERALLVAKEYHNFVNAHEHMLAIMGLEMTDFGKAIAGIHEPVRRYTDRVSAQGETLSSHVVHLLQGDADPVRNAFSIYNAALSYLQRTVTKMRKEVDA